MRVDREALDVLRRQLRERVVDRLLQVRVGDVRRVALKPHPDPVEDPLDKAEVGGVHRAGNVDVARRREERVDVGAERLSQMRQRRWPAMAGKTKSARNK